MGKRIPGLEKRANTWFARLGIPADVRHAFQGKTVFIASLGTDDEHTARAKVGGQIADWKRQIDAVRLGKAQPAVSEAERLMSEYRRYRNQKLDEAGAALVLDALTFALGKTGLYDSLRGAATVDAALTATPAARAVFDVITGRATPFLTWIDDYERVAKVQGKTLKQALQDIRKFGAAVQRPVESLSGADVQRWLDGLTSEKTGKPTDQNTKQRALSNLRQYWKRLIAWGHVSQERPCPFDNRITANQETDSEAQERERLPFRPVDVPRLWKRAATEGDGPLTDLIWLGAYTGARLSELMNLKASDIRDVEGVQSFHINKGKTRAARRVFPVHPDIADRVARLIKDANGYLIPCDAANRGAAMSKRFGRLKTDMEFGDLHVFHSLRHTVVSLFREAHCPLEIRNLILGHEDGDERTNTGAAYGDFSAAGRLDWLVKAIQYPY